MKFLVGVTPLSIYQRWNVASGVIQVSCIDTKSNLSDTIMKVLTDDKG